MYKEFYVCAPSACKSAGTLIALGAHKLIVDPFSDLGPLMATDADSPAKKRGSYKKTAAGQISN
jgi:membrane-bound ClpP family serine protease